MCLAAIALDASRRFPLVVAANRDEFFGRPTARLGWWSAGDSSIDVLGGRDLQEGGTWLGLTVAGRMALLTNVRQPDRFDPLAPSRGEIVPLWLRGDLAADRFWSRVALSGYNGFNLIAADFVRGECFWASNQRAHPMRLERGIYGVSNAELDTPWPKVTTLKERVGTALAAADSSAALAAALFNALADKTIAPDDRLPSTGVPIDRERLLSAAHIHVPDNSYGTRCSTLIITERLRRHCVTHVFERTFTPGSELAPLREAVLKDWPPRSTAAGVKRALVQPEVTESPSGDALDAGTLQSHRRVRSLLEPASLPSGLRSSTVGPKGL
jgi:uncharacterized protein with NRDE domain